MEKNPHCVWMNYLAVELYKRIEWGYSTTQICRLLAICVRVHATPAGLNSWWGHVVLPAPVCHLSVISSCISDVFSKHPVCVCVCDHSTFTAVTTAHLHVAGTRQLACVLSHIGLWISDVFVQFGSSSVSNHLTWWITRWIQEASWALKGKFWANTSWALSTCMTSFWKRLPHLIAVMCGNPVFDMVIISVL